MRRIHCYTGPDGQTESGLTLTEVKKRLRKQGGSGYTQHFDRDGSFQENTPITLGNNARTTYQAEYNTSRKFKTTVDVTKAEEDLDVPAFINKVVEQAKAESVETAGVVGGGQIAEYLTADDPAAAALQSLLNEDKPQAVKQETAAAEPAAAEAAEVLEDRIGALADDEPRQEVAEVRETDEEARRNLEAADEKLADLLGKNK